MGMDLKTETTTAPANGANDTIRNAAATVTDADDPAGLDAYAERLRMELKQAMTSGDVDTIYSHQKALKDIPYRKRAATLKQLRAELEKVDDGFEANAKEEADLIALKKLIHTELDPLLDQIQAIGQEAERTNFALTLVYDERRALHEKRRTNKAKIRNIIAEIEADVSGEGVKEFTGEVDYENA